MNCTNEGCFDDAFHQFVIIVYMSRSILLCTLCTISMILACITDELCDSVESSSTAVSSELSSGSELRSGGPSNRYLYSGGIRGGVCAGELGVLVSSITPLGTNGILCWARSKLILLALLQMGCLINLNAQELACKRKFGV